MDTFSKKRKIHIYYFSNSPSFSLFLFLFPYTQKHHFNQFAICIKTLLFMNIINTKNCLCKHWYQLNLKQMFIHCIHSKHRRSPYSIKRVLLKWTVEGVQSPHIIPISLLTDPQYLPGDVSTLSWYMCPVIIEQQSVEVL